MEQLRLTEEQKQLLHEIWYKQKVLVGRDKLFNYIRSNHPEEKISRRNVMRWLKLQKAHQLTVRPPPRQHTSLMDNVRSVGYMSCDLTGNLPRDRGYNYIFILCDVASRKTYCEPLKGKTAAETRDALKKIIEKNPDMKLSILKSDNGSEFHAEFSDYLKEINCKQLFSVPATPWSNRSERQIGFLKSLLTKNEIITGSKAWVNALPILVNNMNAVVNQSTKMTPNEVAQGGLPRDINEDRSKAYGVSKRHLSTKSTYKLGDKVRLRLKKTGNYQKMKTTYSEEVYIIVKVVHATNSRLITYKISKDGINQERGSYNVTELLLAENRESLLPDQQQEDTEVGVRTVFDQREVDLLLIDADPNLATIRETRHPEPIEEDEYEVESILGRRKFSKQVKYLVKFLGYQKEFSQWMPAKHIFAPKIMREFRKKERLKKRKK